MQFSKIPALQFYAFGSAELGSMVATLGTGSNMTNDRAAGGSGPQKGLLTWAHRVGKRWVKWIMKQRYGNEEAAIDVVRKQDPNFANKHFPRDGNVDPADFTPKGFLVRTQIDAVSHCIRVVLYSSNQMFYKRACFCKLPVVQLLH